MESKELLYERLKKLLIKSEEDLALSKLELKKEKIKTQEARDYLERIRIRLLIRNFEGNNIAGLNNKKIQTKLIELTYNIINTTPPH